MHAQKYVPSRGMSADSLVRRSCRQGMTPAVADPSQTPRWEKGRKVCVLCLIAVNTQLHMLQ